MADWKKNPRPGGNGCQYMQKSFKVPVDLHHVPQDEWDAIFAPKPEGAPSEEAPPNPNLDRKFVAEEEDDLEGVLTIKYRETGVPHCRMSLMNAAEIYLALHDYYEELRN